MLSPDGAPAEVGVLGVVLLASTRLMLLLKTMRDLAMVVSRDEEADDGIREPGLRAVLAGVEGADVTTGTSGLVGSSLVKVPWRIRVGSATGATFALDPPIAPHEGCLSRIFGMSELLLLLLLRTDPFPFISSEFRFELTLVLALSGCGRPLASTTVLWLLNLGVVSGPTGSFLVAAGAAGVLAITAGAETTDFRYGDTYAGFLVPRTAFATSGTAGDGLILGAILVGVGTLLGLECGVRFCGAGGGRVTGIW